MSYTQFQLSNLRLNAQQISPNGYLTVTVDVQNTGRCAGDEVVQLYIRDMASIVTRPVRELKGFQRITLQSGEKRQVEFKLTPAELCFYNREMVCRVEPGDFKVFAGSSSEGGLEAVFKVTEK